MSTMLIEVRPTTPYIPIPPVITLLLLALAVPQAPVEVTYTGTVSAAGNSLAVPALSTVMPGDPIQFRFTVNTPGNLGGVGQLDIYTVQGASIDVQVGSSSLTGGSSAGGCFFFNRDPNGLGDILTSTFSLPSSVSLALTVNDPTSTAWDSVDIIQAIGFYPMSAFSLNALELSDSGGTLLADFQSLEIAFAGGNLGTSYCGPGAPNSTGASGELTADGNAVIMANNVILTASSLPPNAFGFFIASTSQGMVIHPGGSEGNLCLGGAIGRYVGPGEIQNAGAAGEFSLALDVTSIPQPSGSVAVMAGEMWNFQCWHRDMVAMASASNFTNGLEITFQ